MPKPHYSTTDKSSIQPYSAGFGGIKVEEIQHCVKCSQLARAYEAETMNWFRLEGHLRIAEYGRDEDGAQKIALELDAVIRRRAELRIATDLHNTSAHNKSRTTTS